MKIIRWSISNEMRRASRISADAEAVIVAALEKTPHATFVARKTGWSYSTVWRVADRAGIELTAGREARGYKRLPAAQRAKIEAALQANPKALQREIAQQTGVSRVTVSRIEGGVRRPRRPAPQDG
jgi:hypothetical protein